MWRENMRTFQKVEFSSTNCCNYWTLSRIHQAQPLLQHNDHHLLNHLHLFMHINQPLHTSMHLSYIHCLVSLQTQDFLPAIMLCDTYLQRLWTPSFLMILPCLIWSTLFHRLVPSSHCFVTIPFTHQFTWTSLTCSNCGVCIPRSNRLDLSSYLQR